MGKRGPASEGGRYKIEERVETRPSAFGMSGAGVAAAPAMEPVEKSAQPGMAVPQVAAAVVVKEKTAEVSAGGLDAGQVAEIKAGIQGAAKLFGGLLAHAFRMVPDGIR